MPLPTQTDTPTPESPDPSLSSPDGEFQAVLENALGHPALRPQAIKILDKNGVLVWEIPYQHETAMVDPHPRLTIYGWSDDSMYLYFYYSSSPDGGDRAFWWDGFDLQRIDVETGEIEQVIPGERKGWVSFTFSPDGTQLAFTRQQDQPAILFVRDLSTGVEKTTTVISPAKTYVRVGDIHWSPSGQGIAYQTESDDYIAQTVYLDLSTLEQRLVREYVVPASFFDGWSEDGRLQFFDIDGGVQVVQVDPASNETVVIGTPTPR